MATLDEALLEARATWPGIALDDAAFARELGARVKGDAEALFGLKVPDLFLAWACLQGDAAALRHFDALLGRLEGALQGFDQGNAFPGEVLQRLRERLLVGVDGRPKLQEYGGRGALEKWARVAAVRVALSLREAAKPGTELGSDELPELQAPGDSPEIRLLKERHRPQFTAAFRAALEELGPRDRNVLRLAFVDGLNGEQIAHLYGTHRSTVSRWISSSREAVFERTRALLAAQLGLTGSQVDSLVGAVRSGLDVSVRSLLGE
ncbi:MAG: sigma-70 family RNA polymerase sigma factor [Myxococcaceae bacterium]